MGTSTPAPGHLASRQTPPSDDRFSKIYPIELMSIEQRRRVTHMLTLMFTPFPSWRFSVTAWAMPEIPPPIIATLNSELFRDMLL